MLAKIIAAVIAALLLAGTALPATQAPDNVTQPPATESLGLTLEEAQAIALAHAGVAAEEATALHSHYDMDDGIPEWDVDFRVGDWEYDYSIHAETGAVLEWDKDYEPVASAAVPVQPKPTAQITKAEAKAIALQKAGFAEKDIRKVEIELDRERGILVYEVEFEAGNYEYDFDIHAETGEIIRWHKDLDD